MIPMSARRGKTRMSAAGERIVLARDDEFRLSKGVMISSMVYVEMRADEGIDFVRTQSSAASCSITLFSFLGGWRAGRPRIRSHPPIDQDIPPITGLDQIAARDFHPWACR
jgi:hypothetical protein